MSSFPVTQFVTTDPVFEVAADTALGGDLSGTISAGTVAAVNGVAVTGVPTVGQEIVATSATTATWQTPSGRSFAFFGG